MTIYLLNYNNYYNRQVKKFDTIEEYEAIAAASYVNYNFIPGDGITTRIIVNYSLAIVPNYLVVYDADNDEIVSRWFIIDHNRTRSGQYELSLFRDTIVDHYDEVINAPVFIEKATLNADSPFLFNQEDMTFNQIKKSETLLTDKSKCPWIIGYYAKNTPADKLTGTVDANDLDKSYDELITTSFANWEFNATTNPYLGSLNEIEYRIYAKSITASIGFQAQQGFIHFDKNGNYTGWKFTSESDYSLSTNFKGPMAGEELQPLFQENKSILESYLSDYITINSETDINKFLNYNGKIIKDVDGKYFSISIYSDGEEKLVTNVPSGGDLYINIDNIVKTSTIITGNSNSGSYKVYTKRPKYKMIATELTSMETTWDMSGPKLITDDAPYNIFAIPYGNTSLYFGEYITATSNATIGIATASSIIKVMGDYLYDIQLLPYCPIETYEKSIVLFDNEAFSLIKTPLAKDQEEETLENHISYILNISRANFTKNLNYSIDAPTDAIETKVSNECDKYRICSPNFNGYFDFSVAKNNGVNSFNIDCSYKPFQPYIHVNPDFKGLYGEDFNDARGLICGGDFSLSQLRDKWQDYQINNKNYQEIFSRQIENMEVSNKYQRIESIGNIFTGTLSAGATSGIAGNMLFPGTGAAIGATAGAAFSLAGGIADYHILTQMQKENLDYTKDQFGYQLGNIQALPYTLTKVSSLNNNNKYFPFVEYYTCTDEEKEAFKNKLKYNGMTVMAIGTIRDYIKTEKTYIKGKLIRIENFSEDYHILSVIADELNKGVFI